MDRWWAPQRPTVEPDAVVLAMLEPGDLGSSMLAVHRAGAAAIETVSKSALPSEEKLVTAMVMAREKVADKVVDSVSKSVPSGSYAALLVRDVLDDAEDAALRLYRSAVSKGVSPPVAASRAAAVYGVPASSLGKYIQLATDPRSNPTTVTDAADRTLMEYVAKLVATEQADGEAVEVSKAPGQGAYQEKPWDETQVRRDWRGRFADEGRTAQAAGQQPPPMSTLDRIREKLGLRAQSAPPAQVSEKKPAQRKTSTVRSARTTRTSTSRPRQATASRAPQKRRTTLRRQGNARKATKAERQATLKRDIRMQGLVEEPPPVRKPEAIVAPPKRGGDLTPEMLKPLPDLGMPAHDLDDAFTIHLSDKDARSFMQKVRTQTFGFAQPGERVFRLGHLMEASGLDPESSSSTASAEARAGLAQADYGALDLDEDQVYDVEVVHEEDIRSSGMSDEMYLSRRQMEIAEGDEDELPYVQRLPLYQQHGTMELDDDGRAVVREDWAIVHFMPQEGKDWEDRVIPSIDEFVIPYGAQGYVDDSTKWEQAHLDPNQAYRVINPAGPGHLAKPQRFWDAKNGVVVNRWFITPVSEYELERIIGSDDVGKADRQGFQEPWVEAEVVRDTLGRFAPEGAKPVQRKVQKPIKAKRSVRSSRSVRTTRALPPAQQDKLGQSKLGQGKLIQSPAARQKAMTRQVMRQVVMQRVERMPEEQRRELPVLDDRKRYIVMSARQSMDFLRRLEKNPDGSYLVPTRMPLRLADPVDGDTVERQLAENVAAEVELQEGPAQTTFGEWTGRRAAGKFPWRGAEDDFDLQMHVDSIFESFPDVAQIHVDKYGEPGYAHLYVNRRPVGQQLLIEIADDTDLSQPLEVVPLGLFKSNDMLRRRTLGSGGTYLTGSALVTGDDEDSPIRARAPFQHLRMQNADLWRVRLQND